MQAPETFGQTPDSDDSPVFFTGCSHDSPRKVNKKPNVVDPTKILSSIDFDQLKQSVNLILSHNVTPVNHRSTLSNISSSIDERSSIRCHLFPIVNNNGAMNTDHGNPPPVRHQPPTHTYHSRKYSPIHVTEKLPPCRNLNPEHRSDPVGKSNQSHDAYYENDCSGNLTNNSSLFSPHNLTANDSISQQYKRRAAEQPENHRAKRPVLLPTPEVADNNIQNSSQNRTDEDHDWKPLTPLCSPKQFSEQLPISRKRPHPDNTHIEPRQLATPTNLHSTEIAENFYEQSEHSVNKYERQVPGRPWNHVRRGASHKRPFDAPFNPSKRTKLSPHLHTRPRDNWSCWEQLTKDIWQLYTENKQSQIVFDSKMALRNQLHDILLKTFPLCGLFVVGSSMTGLGAKNSDMDMCLMLSHNEISQEEEAPDILSAVYGIFSHFSFLHDLELIPAKVPILRFKDSIRKVEVDLNVNNAVGIRNTQLLKSYARMDERVPPLVLLTKMWAKCHDINDAKHHTLSSYSLVLMVIHFLQYKCCPPVLPCLQRSNPEKFNPYSDVRTLKLVEDLPPFKSDNCQPLSELFLDFLNYYANEFDYTNDVISVRTGSIVPKLAAMNNSSPKNKRGHWKHICIEEPFDLTNTACSVFKDSAFFHVRDVFLRSWNMLRGSGTLKSILDLRRLSFKAK